ncbi:hypothetical protein VP01_1549g3 [Puccinia sorghi]|uniref:Uncharacterized protein n=1 Tax=Puccinia sorghi TaxID=27349 RepID=A0A0L6VIU2_9BASI|nr:hypothetical protein VP01_1549g3 [Puccinia sorghi]
METIKYNQEAINLSTLRKWCQKTSCQKKQVSPNSNHMRRTMQHLHPLPRRRCYQPVLPTPGYQVLVEVKKPASIFVKTPDGEPFSLELSENEKIVPGNNGDAVPVNQLPTQFSSSAECINWERPRHATPGSPPEPSPPKSSFVGPDEGKMIEDSHAQDSPRSGTQYPYTNDPTGRPPDSMQLVASIGELTPQPVVNSSKGLDAQEPPAVALSHSYELEPVIQASSKSPEPVHNVPFVSMTHMRLKVLKKTTDQRSSTNVANVTDQLISTSECQCLNFPAPEETRELPKSTVSPSLNPGIAGNPRKGFPTRLSHHSMSTTNSEAHSEIVKHLPKLKMNLPLARLQRDSKNTCWIRMLLVPFLGPVMRRCCLHILPAISTIENASEVKISSSHLLGWPRSRRAAPCTLNVQVAFRLVPWHVSASLSSEPLINLSLSPLKSGSQMRLTNRSSLPSEIDDMESNEQVDNKQQFPSKVSPAPAPPSNALIHAHCLQMGARQARDGKSSSEQAAYQPPQSAPFLGLGSPPLYNPQAYVQSGYRPSHQNLVHPLPLWTLKTIVSLPNPDPTDIDALGETPQNMKEVTIDEAAEAKRPKDRRKTQEWARLHQDPKAHPLVSLNCTISL